MAKRSIQLAIVENLDIISMCSGFNNPHRKLKPLSLIICSHDVTCLECERKSALILNITSGIVEIQT